jgi:hypothetical protein
MADLFIELVGAVVVAVSLFYVSDNSVVRAVVVVAVALFGCWYGAGLLRAYRLDHRG